MLGLTRSKGGGVAAGQAGVIRARTSVDYPVTSGNVAPTAGWTVLVYTTGIVDTGAGARKALLDYGWGNGDRGAYLRINTTTGAIELAVARAGTTASVVASYTYSGSLSDARLFWGRISADGLTAEVGEGDPALITPGTATITGGVDTTADAPASFMVQDGDTTHNVVGGFGVAVVEEYMSDAEVAAADGSFQAVKDAAAAKGAAWVLGLDVVAGVTRVTSAADLSDPSGTHTWTIAALTGQLLAPLPSLPGWERVLTADDVHKSAENVNIQPGFTLLAWGDLDTGGGSTRQIVIEYGYTGVLGIGAQLRYNRAASRIEAACYRADGTAVATAITAPSNPATVGQHMIAGKVTSTFVRACYKPSATAAQYNNGSLSGGPKTGDAGPLTLGSVDPDRAASSLWGVKGKYVCAVIDAEISDADFEAYAALGAFGVLAAIADHGAIAHTLAPEGLANAANMTDPLVDREGAFTFAIEAGNNPMRAWDGST